MKEVFLNEIKSSNSEFWCECKDKAKEVLIRTSEWQALAFKVDDVSQIIATYMVERLNKWNESGSLSKIETLAETKKWLLQRYISMVKNSQNPKYRSIYTPIFLEEYNDEEHANNDMSAFEYAALEEFKYFADEEKIEIMKQVWRDNIYDTDFDTQDLEDLCAKYGAPPPTEFIDFNHKFEMGEEKISAGLVQLTIKF